MAHEWMVIDRVAVEEELRRVFEPSVVQVMVSVLNQAAVSAVEVTRLDLQALRETMHELAQAQLRTEARLEELGTTVGRLVLAQERTETQVQRLTDIVGDLKGRMLELTYSGRAYSYFGILLRRIRVVDPSDLDDDLLEHLTHEEFKDWLRIDLVLSGKPRYRPDTEPIWLVVEISAVVDEHDVERAQKRASYLRRAHYRALPLVAGEKITPGARALAEAQHVPLTLDGQVYFWDDALDTILID